MRQGSGVSVALYVAFGVEVFVGLVDVEVVQEVIDLVLTEFDRLALLEESLLTCVFVFLVVGKVFVQGEALHRLLMLLAALPTLLLLTALPRGTLRLRSHKRTT